MSDDSTDIGSMKALLSDARDRIKESETRSTMKIEEVEKRVTGTLTEIETKFDILNNKLLEWLPLLTNLKAIEETRRNMNILLIVAFTSTIASWILAIFIYFIKKGGSL